MGWFSKLLGRRNAPEEPEEEAPGLSERFVQLYCGNGPAAFVRQEHLSEVVGERDWAFSMDDGTLSFGDDLQFPVQVLGTESESSGTWLWAWANEASGLPDTLLEAVSTLRGLHDVPEAQAAQLPLESVDGHALCNALGPLVGARPTTEDRTTVAPCSCSSWTGWASQPWVLPTSRTSCGSSLPWSSRT